MNALQLRMPDAAGVKAGSGLTSEALQRRMEGAAAGEAGAYGWAHGARRIRRGWGGAMRFRLLRFADARLPSERMTDTDKTAATLIVKASGPHAARLGYATPGSAGLDLPAAEAATLPPGGWVAVGTGLRLELPEGHEGQVRPRSGLAAKHGVTVLNAPGTIDADYRGEVRVLLINHGAEPYDVTPGDRIAQLVIAPVVQLPVLDVETLTSTARQDGGFGHTGR